MSPLSRNYITVLLLLLNSIKKGYNGSPLVQLSNNVGSRIFDETKHTESFGPTQKESQKIR